MSPVNATFSQGHYHFKLKSVKTQVGTKHNQHHSVVGFDLEPTSEADTFKGLEEITGRILHIEDNEAKNDVNLPTAGRISLYQSSLEMILYGSRSNIDLIQSAYLHNPHSHGILQITTDHKLRSTLIKKGDGQDAIMERYSPR